MNNLISYIIPSRGRKEILLWHLGELNKQVSHNFEVIVAVNEPVEGDWVESAMDQSYPVLIVDASGKDGPAYARNEGVKSANGDYFVFVNDDDLPQSDFLARFYYDFIVMKVQIVQGYTRWHREVENEFTAFLDLTGLQTNWAAVKDEGGNFKREISAGFGVTSAWGTTRKLFESENGFDESFSGAAWEDIELCYRLQQRNIPAIFNQYAANYHYHRYDLPSFAKRCEMEGYHRLTLCKKHPEFSPNLLPPEGIRAAVKTEKAELLSWATELNMATGDNIKTERWNRWQQACSLFSMMGLARRIKEDSLSIPAIQVLIHLHKPENVYQACAGIRAIEAGHLSYAAHTAEWIVQDVPDNWAAWAYAGEINKLTNNPELATICYNESGYINPTAEWIGGK